MSVFSFKHKHQTVMDMTEGVIWRQLVTFALPLFVGNIFQQFYNTVDSIVVGNFVGADALGAVAATVPIVFMLIGLFIGFAMGSTITISQYFGAKDIVNLRRATHTAVVATTLISIVLAGVGYFTTPIMLRLMDTPPTVMTEAVVYLQIFMLGLPGGMLYNMGAAILRAVGDSKRPLYFLIFSSVLNIFLDLLFVIKFNLGVSGVALATIIAQFTSGVLVFLLLFRSHECHSLSWDEMKIDKRILKRVIGLGLPSGLQMAITSFSNIFVQAYINSYGAASTAGWGICARIDAFVILPTQSLAMAITTFVGQNTGARKLDRIKRGVRQCTILAIGLTMSIVTVLYIATPFMVGLFNRDPDVLYYGVLFLRVNMLFDVFNVLNQVYAGALRGSGDSKTPMVIMLASFVLFRQVYLFIVSRVAPSIYAISFGYPAGWIFCCLMLFIHIKRSRWGKDVPDIN